MNRPEIDQKKGVVPPWIEKTLKEAGVTPPKESFGACLRTVKCSHDQEETDAYIAEMESRHNAEISQLRSKFQCILDKVSRSIVDASKTLTTIAQDALHDAYETMHSVEPKPEYVVNADANKVSDISSDNDIRRKDLDEMKRSIAQAVEKFNKNHPHSLTDAEKLKLKSIFAFWIDWNRSC